MKLPALSSSDQTRLFGWILALGTLLLYIRTLGFDFITYDDNHYVYGNPFILKGITFDFLKWVFSNIYFSNWQPLTLISYAAEWPIYKSWAGGYHLTNVLLHIANTLLIFFLFKKTTSSLVKSFLVAAVFAWHPVKLESVAWIASRKDVLSTFFILLSLHFYVIEHFQRHNKTKNSLPFILGSLFFYLCSLMSKTIYVSLPFILLIFDFWPLRRVDKSFFSRVREKIPYFLLSLFFCWVTIKSQAEALSNAPHSFGPVNPANILRAYWDYVLLFLWPEKISIFYRYPSIINLWVSYAAASAWVIFSGVLFYKRHTWRPAWAGWCFFIVTLLPVIGLMKVGRHWIACRYMYLPTMGLSLIGIWGGAATANFLRIRINLQKIILAFGLIGLIAITSINMAYWQNSVTLFLHALKLDPLNYEAHIQFMDWLNSLGYYELAGQHALDALKNSPTFAATEKFQWQELFYIGKASWSRGEKENAIQYFDAARKELHKIAALESKKAPLLNKCIGLMQANSSEPCSPA